MEYIMWMKIVQATTGLWIRFYERGLIRLTPLYSTRKPFAGFKKQGQTFKLFSATDLVTCRSQQFSEVFSLKDTKYSSLHILRIKANLLKHHMIYSNGIHCGKREKCLCQIDWGFISRIFVSTLDADLPSGRNKRIQTSSL